MGPSGVIGLDFAAVFTLADACGVERADLAEVLPLFERCLILYYSGDEESGPSEDSD